jgi:SecD/SecF fusion protein
LTGIILFIFGTGPIKGFATTLIIGIITSLFTSTLITRLIFDRICAREKMQKLTFTTVITKKWFKDTNFNFIKARKFGYIFSGILMLVMIISLCTRGLKQGIDFSGGRNYVIRFEQPVDIDEVRETLSNVFTESQVSVITMGEDNQIRFSTNYLINSTDENVDEQIEGMLFETLKSSNCLAPEVTKQMFLERYSVKDGQYVLATADNEDNFGIQSSQKVGPTVANDIKVSAIWAVLFSMIVIGLYILIRFRNLSFSLGAVIALVHDTLFILGVYSLFYTIMPFSLEIDQTFIAAILTVVGYSINDTVVIFDRIRENLGLFQKRESKDLINMSLNTTLVRTFSTSLSTGIVLLAMFIFGGETIRGFLFAMLAGIVVGVYSTLFVAVPLTYDIQTRKEKKALKAK